MSTPRGSAGYLEVGQAGHQLLDTALGEGDRDLLVVTRELGGYDLALSEDLKTSFSPFIPGDDDASWKLRSEVWKDERTVVGASDAGAHLDMIDTFTCTTSLLGPGVREKGLLGLEEAVHQLTAIPAELYGLRERGRLAEGFHADVVVFDPERVGPEPVETRHDLPRGAARLYAGAEGIDHVLVNGVEVVRGKEFTGARPGTVLRSGTDTETVEVPGERDRKRGSAH